MVVRKNQSGLTLVELLVVMVIIGVLASITSVSSYCYINDTDVRKLKSDAVNIQARIKSIYNESDSIPVTGSGITEISPEVKKEMEERLIVARGTGTSKELVDDLINKGVLYKIDTSRIKFSDGITDKDVNKFYVVYVSEDRLKNDPSLLELSRYNSTLVTVDLVTGCSIKPFAVEVGQTRASKTSGALNYDVGKSYIDCPNPDLCKKLKNN